MKNNFDKMVAVLKTKHEIIDTGILNDKHAEILNNLELGLFDGEALSIVFFETGMQRPPHIHDTSAAKFYFIEGVGNILLEGQKIPFKPGTRIDIPAAIPHGFEIETDTLMLSIQDNGGILKQDRSIDFRYE